MHHTPAAVEIDEPAQVGAGALHHVKVEGQVHLLVLRPGEEGLAAVGKGPPGLHVGQHAVAVHDGDGLVQEVAKGVEVWGRGKGNNCVEDGAVLEAQPLHAVEPLSHGARLKPLWLSCCITCNRQERVGAVGNTCVRGSCDTKSGPKRRDGKDTLLQMLQMRSLDLALR